MKRYSSAPCLEDVGSDAKRTRGAEQHADPNIREYLQLALARVLELQREIEEGTYVTEIDSDSGDPDASGNEEDLTKEILTKVFQDLPGTSNSVAKIVNRESRWRNRRVDAIHGKRVQLLGFDTCRRVTHEYMRSIVRDARGRSSSLGRAELRRFDFPLPPDESSRSRDALRASDPRKRESDAQEIRARMLRSLDLHLAVKQRDYTAKLMRSAM